MPRTFEDIGVHIPQVLLPTQRVDLSRWAVIACDQFTSQPDYWQKVEDLAAGTFSTLHLFLPEIYLTQPGVEQRIDQIHSDMQAYLEQDVLYEKEGLILIERQVNGKTRQGLMVCLDLDKYDYNKNSQSLIRATEDTILERLPSRMRVRQGAWLELPHTMVLFDDPEKTVIEPVTAAKDRLEPLYDFELMLGSGHLRAYRVKDPVLEENVIRALRALADPSAFRKRYGVDDNQQILLFAMGDGNHSLAAARAFWEQIKPTVEMDHPARYALVEIVNIHDPALVFEPIHRVMFHKKKDFWVALQQSFGDGMRLLPCQDVNQMVAMIEENVGSVQRVGLVTAEGCKTLEISNPVSTMAVGTLQNFLDEFIASGGAERIDYVHGKNAVTSLGVQPGNIGFYLPKTNKDEFFRMIVLDGAMPRKAFSLGEAEEKRFYMECRKIR